MCRPTAVPDLLIVNKDLQIVASLLWFHVNSAVFLFGLAAVWRGFLLLSGVRFKVNEAIPVVMPVSFRLSSGLYITHVQLRSLARISRPAVLFQGTRDT